MGFEESTVMPGKEKVSSVGFQLETGETELHRLFAIVSMISSISNSSRPSPAWTGSAG